MHIPDSMLQTPICPVTLSFSLLGVAAAVTGAVAAVKKADRPDTARFSLVAALIFAAQMLILHIAGGISHHLPEATLAIALLTFALARLLAPPLQGLAVTNRG